MKKFTVVRKRKFAGGIMPYWIIVAMRKEVFMERYGLQGDMCEMSSAGFPVPRMNAEELDRLGPRIMSGQTMEIEVHDDISTLFISTVDGCLSEEISIDPYVASGNEIVVTTRGGFKSLPHPVIVG